MTKIEKLARAFSHGLLHEIGLANLRTVIAANRIVGTPACASHDYCDSNMTMNAAFRRVTGHRAASDSDADNTLWNAAWDLAKGAEFYLNPPVPADDYDEWDLRDCMRAGIAIGATRRLGYFVSSPVGFVGRIATLQEAYCYAFEAQSMVSISDHRPIFVEHENGSVDLVLVHMKQGVCAATVRHTWPAPAVT